MRDNFFFQNRPYSPRFLFFRFHMIQVVDKKRYLGLLRKDIIRGYPVLIGKENTGKNAIKGLIINE
ncbi:hypothetical protein [Porphyromonas macacae]|uniref:hypothetical protein n=1 Tax=Porphyromonas macacae TaxID=28115 RepID=UPI001EE37A16|nr:hypothetical protein [Porphyromonas macacae]